MAQKPYITADDELIFVDDSEYEGFIQDYPGSKEYEGKLTSYVSDDGILTRDVTEEQYLQYKEAFPNHEEYKEDYEIPVLNPTAPGGVGDPTTLNLKKSTAGTMIDMATSAAPWEAAEKALKLTPLGKSTHGLLGHGAVLGAKALASTFGRKLIGDPLKTALNIHPDDSARPGYGKVFLEEFAFGGAAEAVGAGLRFGANYLRSGKTSKEAKRLVEDLNNLGIDNATLAMSYGDERLIAKEAEKLRAMGARSEGRQLLDKTTEAVSKNLEDLGEYGFLTKQGDEASRAVGRGEMGSRELVAARKAANEAFDRARGYYEFSNQFIPKSLVSKDLGVHKFILDQADSGMDGYQKLRRLLSATRVKGSEVDAFITQLKTIDSDPNFPGVNYELLDKIRREIGTAGKSHFSSFVPDNDTTRFFKGLYQTVNDDLRGMLGKIPNKEGVDALEFIEKGNKAWQEGIEINKKFLSKFENKSLFPDEIETMVRQMAYGRNAQADRFEFLYKNFSKNDRSKFRSMFFNNMTRGANQTDGITNFFKNYNKMDKNVRNLVFHKSAHRDAINSLEKASKWVFNIEAATKGAVKNPIDIRAALTASAGLGLGTAGMAQFGAHSGPAGYYGALGMAAYSALRMGANRVRAELLQHPETAILIADIVQSADKDIAKKLFRLGKIAQESKDPGVISAVAEFNADIFNFIGESRKGDTENAVE